MGRLDSSSSGGRLKKKKDLKTIEGILDFAKSKGQEPPEERERFSALRKIGGALNIGTAATAGAVRGAIRPDVSIGQGIRQGIQDRETFGFQNILQEDIGIKPETRGGKIALGTAGFVADVLFDPLTYLTFGASAGIKVGGKTLTKQGTKLFQQTRKGIVDATEQKLLKQGIEPTAAKRIADRRNKGLINDLFQRATGKKGLTDETAEQFIKAGVDTRSVQTLQNLGSKLIDAGGVKFMGKTLVKSSTLAKTPVGRAARRLGEQEIVQAIKNTLGKTFVADFKKNKDLIQVVDKANRQVRKAFGDIAKKNEELFKNLTDDEASEFFNEVFKKKLEIISSSDQITGEGLQTLNTKFGLKIKDKDQAMRMLNSLEDITESKVIKIREKIDDLVSPFFKEREDLIKQGGKLPDTVSGLQKAPQVRGFGNVDELNRTIGGLKDLLKQLRKQKGGGRTARLGTQENIDLTDDALVNLRTRLITAEEERLGGVVDNLINKLENLKEAKIKPKTSTKGLKPATALQRVAKLEKDILKLQNELAEKSGLLGQVVDARRIAKGRQKSEKLTFEDEKLQKLADELFEGDNAIVPRFAKLAGIKDEDAIKFYIPSKFKDKLAVKDFSVGRVLQSPNLSFLKTFKGVEDDLIKNPATAYTLGQAEVVNARIKDRAFRSLVSKIGKKEADDIHTELITRKGIGEEKLEGYFTKEVAEELRNFLSPKDNEIEELFRLSGFDYATGIFKGYVTSLFPAFHIRNITSNQFQNMVKIGVDVGNLRLQTLAGTIARGKNLEKEITLKTGEKISLKEIRDRITKESDILEDYSSILSREELLQERRVFQKSSINPLSRRFVALEKGRKLGQFSEQQAKVVSVLSAVMSGRGVKEGIKQAEEALFNYSKLTPFEKTFMRRLIPFYTWSRKNLEFQIKALATQPGKVAAQLKAFNNISTGQDGKITEEDIDGLPFWVIESLGIKAGTNEFNQNQFITGFGLPIEEFFQRFSGENSPLTNAVQKTFLQTNPILKVPLEKATGQDFFRGRPIMEITDAQDLASMLSILPAPVEKEFKEFLNFKESTKKVYRNGKVVGEVPKYEADPIALHIIRNLPASRFVSTAGFLSEPDETTSNFQKAIKFFTGVRFESVDQKQQKYFNDLRRKKQLADWLKRAGLVKEFEILFEPSK